MLCAGGEGKGGCHVRINNVSFTSEVYKLVCLSVCPALCSVYLSVYRFVYVTVCVFLSVHFVNRGCLKHAAKETTWQESTVDITPLCIQQMFFFSKR